MEQSAQKPRPKIEISPGGRLILDRITQEARAEAYLVGGSVRDFLLGISSGDEDITTSLLPEETSALFSDYNQVKAGIKHGTVGIIIDGRNYEVTTFRKDGEYKDHRRPESVEFSLSLEEDLSRRDFTINAMALSPAGEIIDPFGGQADLEAGIVRAVGDPEKRFEEDALRVLRAVRFANRLKFSIEENTRLALKAKAHLLEAIAAERIADEFLKIVSDDPEGVTSLHELGLLKYMYPELEACFLCDQETPYHLYDVGRHSVLAATMGEDLDFRLACLCHDLGKPVTKTYGENGRAHFYGHAEASAQLTREFLRKLFIPKKKISLLEAVVRWHGFLSKRPAKLASMLRDYGEEFFDLVFRVKRADIMAQSDLDRTKKLRLVDIQEEIYLRQKEGPYRLQDLEIDGKDLLDIGYQGPFIGQALDDFLVFVMEKPSRNKRDYLLQRAENMRDRHYS